MTKRERHEIAVVTRLFIKDECDGIRKVYAKLYGSLKGLRKYIHNELVAFWTDGNPYLEKQYLDYEWVKIGNKIINLDDAWCWIKDGIQSELNFKNREK